MTLPDGISLEIAALQKAYASGRTTPLQVLNAVYDEADARGDDATWIAMVPRADALAALAALPMSDDGRPDLDSRPLYGVPFAVKDNFDVARMPTTAACAEFAFVPNRSATVVNRLVDAGAILVGKNNMDQFATGLSGMRSPYGTPPNAFAPDLVPGGSSSGSATAVAAGLVSFSIGTDTAGSGRVPAALQSIVGLKPSRGLVSTAGLVPACRSLDCPSVFALTVADATAVLAVIAGEDEADPWSRAFAPPGSEVSHADLSHATIAVPRPGQYGWGGTPGFDHAWDACVAMLLASGATVKEVDAEPLFEAGRLLYAGPWIAERWAAVEEFASSHPDGLHPVTRAVLAPGPAVTGVDTFRGIARLRELSAATRHMLDGVDALMTPTIPAAFTLAEMAAEPIARNAALGRFTTFTNLLDLAALAVPVSVTDAGIPFGITLHARAGHDGALAALGGALEAVVDAPLGATGWARAEVQRRPRFTTHPAGAGHDELAIAVVGAHLEGLPLHPQLLATGARLLRRSMTAPSYRLFALPETTPPKPGLVRVSSGGAAIEVEVYGMPTGAIGAFLATIPAPLGLGTIVLDDGTAVHGFICEAAACEGALDASAWGGWRAFLADAAFL